MKKINSAVIVDTCTKRLTALKAHVSTKAEIPVAGKVLKAAAVIAIYQTCLDTRASLSTKRAEVKAIQTDSANAEASRRAADRALKAWVVNTFGATSQQAHDFGFPPPKTPTRTAESKAQAVLQAKATREARHTMGSRQKEKVKGAIVAPTVPAAPAPQPVQVTGPVVINLPASTTATAAPTPKESPAPAPVATAATPVTPAPTSVISDAQATVATPSVLNGALNGAAHA